MRLIVAWEHEIKLRPCLVSQHSGFTSFCDRGETEATFLRTLKIRDAKLRLPVRICKCSMRLLRLIQMPLLKRSKSIFPARSIAALWRSILRSSVLRGSIKKSVTCVRAKQARCSIETLVVAKGTALNGFDQTCVYRRIWSKNKHDQALRPRKGRPANG